MISSFSDWYRSASIDIDDETLAARWKGVEGASDLIDAKFAADLVRLASGKKPKSEDFDSEIRTVFRDNDEGFPESGNEHELQVLAGCILAHQLAMPVNEEVAVAVLISSACGVRKFEAGIDLLGMAQHAADRVSKGGRDRTKPVLKTYTHNERYKQILDQFDTTDGNKAAVKTAFTQFAATSEAILSLVQQQSNSEARRLQKLIDLQDEELQFAWWLIGDWSDHWQTPFSKLPAEGRPILLSAEAANLTTNMVEPPAFEAILARIGINAKSTTTIPQAVMACDKERVEALARESVDPFFFPIHFAITRANECPGDDSWTTAWGNLTSIVPDTKIPALEIARQFHREIKFLEALEG